MVEYVSLNGESLWQEEYEWIPPVIGYGIESPDGKRYRVVDVWIIHPKHGRFEYGVHAFLEPVSPRDDLLHRIDPDYYTASKPNVW